MTAEKGEEGRGKGENPAELLERVFAHIADTRMAGLPILNTALNVQAVGFREWQDNWVGVLVTPWTISLMLMPGEKGPLKTLGPEEKVTREFPSGKYEFMGLNEPTLGSCQTCSLISPVFDISSQEDAVRVANEVMEALFVAEQSEEKLEAERKRMQEMARLNGEPMKDEGVSRRDFLRGNFLGM
jgi:[NiFe] hydrogenase assembly HybE family chaperone